MNICTSCGDKVPESLGDTCSDCIDERIREMHEDGEHVTDCPHCEEEREKAEAMEER